MFSLYSFEVTFDYFQNFKRKDINKKAIENIYLEKSKKEKISLQLSPNMFLDEEEQNILPLSGYPLMKTLMCNENGKLIKYFSIDTDLIIMIKFMITIILIF